MRQKTYKLSVLPLFEEDLNEIVDYITNKLQNPDAALRLVDDIEIAINARLETPLAFAPFQSAKKTASFLLQDQCKKLFCFLCCYR